MKVWLIAAVVLILLLLQWRREGFQSTDLIKAPPYADADYSRFVELMDPTLIAALRTRYTQENPGKQNPDPGTSDGRRLLVAGTVESLFSEFYSRVYAPAAEPLKKEQVTAFLQGYSDPFIKANRDTLAKLLTGYFVDVPPGVGNLPATAAQATSTSYAQKSGYANILANMTGTATGGTSTSALGPTSGGTAAGGGGLMGPASGGAAELRGQTVWGPEFKGVGEGSDTVGGDSTSLRQYPELLGPTPAARTMIPGVGTVAPSKSWQLGQDGSLPDSKSLGSGENAKYLPFSRQPGDKDLIPDPYRVSSTFSTANYSSKTEPVPFLTDFSAFQK